MLRAAVFAIAFVLSVTAWAQDAPRFTLAEETLIARNEALLALLPIDPHGVRKIVDAVVAAKEKPPTASAPARDRQRDVNAVVIDPARNPDLEVFQRASPEAAYDLFQLLKRVGGRAK
jgi:hypothetical protein